MSGARLEENNGGTRPEENNGGTRPEESNGGTRLEGGNGGAGPEASSVGEAHIRCMGLTVRYGRRTALENVSLEVAPGQVFALLGRNGAGKSSLVRALLGQRRAEGGRLQLLGLDPWTQRAALMARVGVVPERCVLPPAMTGAELVAWCGGLHPRWDGPGALARLERFGLPPHAQVRELSRGQQSQLALSLALASRPELMVLDDPTLGLDPVARRAFQQELLGELADRGCTVLLTSHDLSGVEALADRVGILRRGRLVLDADLETLKGAFRRVACGPAAAPALKPLLEGQEHLGTREGALGLETVLIRCTPELERALEAAGAVAVRPMGLEDIFIAIEGEEGEVKA